MTPLRVQWQEHLQSVLSGHPSPQTAIEIEQPREYPVNAYVRPSLTPAQFNNLRTVNSTTFEGPNIFEGCAQYFETLSASSVPPATDLACRQEILRLLKSLPDDDPDLTCVKEVET